MILNFNLLKTIFFTLYFISFFFPLYAQSGLLLKHADITRGKVLSNREEVKILEGNVHVQQDSTEIFCDKATYHPLRDMLVLVGNVKLTRGNDILTAKKLTYYELEKLAIAENDVYLDRPGQNMRSEYLEYYYETDRAFARTNLILTDEPSNAFVTAIQGKYSPEENFSRVEKDAHFWQINRFSGDTLHIYAEAMEYHFKPIRKAIATDSVRIIRGDLTARCDSAVYLLDEEKVFLEMNPQAEQQNNQMAGQQMELDLKGMVLHRITVKGRAVAKSVEDSTNGKINQLTGQEIIAFLKNRKINELWAVDNARSLYYIKDQNQEQGINTASADTIRIYFKGGEVDNISVKGGSQGIFYPADYKGEIETEF